MCYSSSLNEPPGGGEDRRPQQSELRRREARTSGEQQPSHQLHQQQQPLPFDSLIHFLQVLGFSPPQEYSPGTTGPADSQASGSEHHRGLDGRAGRRQSEDLNAETIRQQRSSQSSHHDFPAGSSQDIWSGALRDAYGITGVCYLIQKVSMAIIAVSVAIIAVSIQLLTPDSFLRNFTFLVLVLGLRLPLPAVLLSQAIYFGLGVLSDWDDWWLIGLLGWAFYKMVLRRQNLINIQYWRDWWNNLEINRVV